MKHIKVYLLLLMTVLYAASATAVPLGNGRSVDVFNLEFGEQLHRQAVFKVLKDDNGFAWMATRSVITRYDGRRMTYYRLNESELITDTDGHNTKIHIGPDNSLWAFTDNGQIYKYNNDDRFDLYCSLHKINPVLRLNDIVFDDLGQLWLATNNGLYSIYRNNGAEHVLGETLLLGSVINSVEKAAGGMSIVNTADGAMLARWDNGVLRVDRTLLEGYNVMCSFFDSDSGKLWLGTINAGLLGYDLRRDIVLEGSFSGTIPHVPIRAIARFADGRLLVGLDGAGVYNLDQKSLKAVPFISENESTGAMLRGNGVYDIMVDGNKIWVATYTGGITIINVPDFYELIAHIPYNTRSLPNNRVNSIIEDRDGDLWLATDAGVSLYKPRENLWRHFVQDGKTYLTLCEDRDGRIWCGGYSAGTLCIDKSRGVIRSIRSLDGDPNQTDDIYASHLDSEGRLWLGGLSNKTACIANPNRMDEAIEHYDITGVNSIQPVRNDSLMFNTYNGFILLDKHSGYFRHYFTNPAEQGIATSSFIYTGTAVGSKLWLGTSGGGLNSYDIVTGEVVNYSTYDGLPSNFIFQILKGVGEMMWISSGNGIFCFDPHEGKLVFNVEDLPVSDFVFMSGTRLRDGRMAFGSVGGALFIDPARIKPEYTAPNLFFSDFSIFYNVVNPGDNPSVLSDRINNTGEVRLRHNQNSFSIGFGAIELYHPDKYLYSYRLEGFDDWAPEGYYSKADYTNIPPGTYDLQVKCFNKNSPNDYVIRSVGITVLPPFWNTALAWMIYLVLLMALVFGVVVYFRKKAENNRFNDKINFFINVAHDIRTPLSLVTGPLKDLSNEENLSKSGRYYLDMAIQNSGKLFSLVSRLLDFHKMEMVSAKSHYSPIDLDVYLRQKADEFRLMAEKKDITLTVDIPRQTLFVDADFDKLNHILDNLISNAIKYTQTGGKVVLRLVFNNRKIVFEVEDNGIGIHRREHKKIFTDFYRSKSARKSGEGGSGIGLSIARRLAAKMKGHLTFSSEEGKGSVFRLTIPFIEPKNVQPVTEKIDDIPAEDEDMTMLEEERANDKSSILIVEDNDDMRSYLTYSLSDEYRTYAVSSAEDALKFLSSRTIDVVVSDVMMDGMGGIELAGRLKTNFETSHIFVILLTASTRQENMIKGFEAGADDYITKPFSLDLLRMKISNLLKTRRKIQQHYLSSFYAGPVEEETPQNEQSFQVSSIDEDFLKRAVKIVTENISNPDFIINDLCRGMAMSRTLMYEKLRAMTGQSPSEFIRMIRLKHAKELLMTGKYSVSDIAVMTGFADTKYFSTVYKKYYGERPAKIAQRIK